MVFSMLHLLRTVTPPPHNPRQKQLDLLQLQIRLIDRDRRRRNVLFLLLQNHHRPPRYRPKEINLLRFSNRRPLQRLPNSYR